MTTPDLRQADLHSRHAAMSLSAALPCDIVLYLLLPMYADQFHISLAEAGVLLAANRLVRIAGYRWVARFYAQRGDRPTCTLAVCAAIVCALGYTMASGFWALLPLRLLWGMAFAGLNLSTQAMSTSNPQGAARRSGRSRGVIAIGPMLWLPTAALLAPHIGPRLVFALVAATALLGLLAARRLPQHAYAPPQPRRWKLPNALDWWSFLEGLTLDGLFIVGLAYMSKQSFGADGELVAGVLMALRYAGEIVLSPLGGWLAERFGAVKVLVTLSLATCVALVGFGGGLLWLFAGVIVILRALQLPLLAPIVAARTAPEQRVHALAGRAIWRDIGAGMGPMLAGLLLPVMSSLWLYSLAASALALAAIACGRAPAPVPSVSVSSQG
ncbi:MFS transporter [Herbaspirillum seropedicae]|uniref:MFS transporter n=1 Tax=Herbaspirillum seropedicae TaxID=964 RepID=UPI000847EF2A|nr:MFS transporter [Herbaspirillum seropedicae]AON53919.1 major facilitator superfamily permease [Herbaspirillum seropedicae]MDR6398554.1 MFS family permease [Herbaspirillum seropedicae]QDD64033.1 MFS transporter [Herbaspirillum seropedicae]